MQQLFNWRRTIPLIADRPVSQILRGMTIATVMAVPPSARRIEGRARTVSGASRDLYRADGFALEEFSVGGKAEGFQHVGLHLLGEGVDLVDPQIRRSNQIS